MKTARIMRRSEPFRWAELPILPITQLYWSRPVDICGEARICYDEKAVYLRLSAKEREIRAEHTGPIGMPCEDSCLEFFLAPDPRDKRYMNFEFNPNACMYLGIATNIHDLVRMVPEDTELFRPCVRRGEDGWEITFQIPVSFIQFFFPGFMPASGNYVHANFYKCGDETRVPHFLSWNELTSPTPDFHRSCDFGTLYFE